MNGLVNSQRQALFFIFYMVSFCSREEILQSLRSAQPAHHFTPTVSSEIVDQSKVPGDLQCSICSQLFKDAVVTPCCGVSYCDDCMSYLF